jgi:predicted RNase H-like nuclease (RuvC/YqgF family)
MAKTAAERQAERRVRIENSIDELTAANSVLVAELARERDTSQALRAELESIKSRLQASEVSALKAQVRDLKKTAQKPVKPTAQAS